MSGLVVTGLSVNAGQVPILTDAGFRAPAGAVTGLIGPNGSGKSTLIGAVVGLKPITAGGVAFDERDLRTMRSADRARILAHVEQAATTAERLTVRDVVALGRIPFQSTWQSAPSPADEQAIDAAIDELGISGLAHRLYDSLSGGEQQRVQLARALAQQPHLLLLDEPTSHLDIAAQLRVLGLLRRHADAGRTVLLAIHDLNLAARFCDHLVVLDGGEVVAEGAPAAVLTPALLHTVYGVRASVANLPGIAYPLVVYDQPADGEPATKSD
jgi:iron complex transport system ATP-binding protein